MAVDKRAWDELIVSPLRDVRGDALAPCFEKCVEEIGRFANPHPRGQNLPCGFDQGIQTEYLRNA
jgi:hypothetical protein